MEVKDFVPTPGATVDISPEKEVTSQRPKRSTSSYCSACAKSVAANIIAAIDNTFFIDCMWLIKL